MIFSNTILKEFKQFVEKDNYKLKTKKTCLSKYGVDQFSKTQKWKELMEFSNLNIYLSAHNNNGVVSAYSNRQIAFFSIGQGFTDTEADNFYTAVQAFQTSLSRQI